MQGREILFRALVQYDDGTQTWEYYTPLSMPCWVDEVGCKILVKDIQATGLHDKNNQPIYEGDIVKCWDNAAKDPAWAYDKEHTGIIEYRPPVFMLKFPGSLTYDTPCVKHWSNDIYLDHWDNAENIEVLGNIYQHPELIHTSSNTKK